jgi:hypothetical protein
MHDVSLGVCQTRNNILPGARAVYCTLYKNVVPQNKNLYVAINFKRSYLKGQCHEIFDLTMLFTLTRF